MPEIHSGRMPLITSEFYAEIFFECNSVSEHGISDWRNIEVKCVNLMLNCCNISWIRYFTFVFMSNPQIQPISFHFFQLLKKKFDKFVNIFRPSKSKNNDFCHAVQQRAVDQKDESWKKSTLFGIIPNNKECFKNELTHQFSCLNIFRFACFFTKPSYQADGRKGVTCRSYSGGFRK